MELPTNTDDDGNMVFEGGVGQISSIVSDLDMIEYEKELTADVVQNAFANKKNRTHNTRQSTNSDQESIETFLEHGFVDKVDQDQMASGDAQIEQSLQYYIERQHYLEDRPMPALPITTAKPPYNGMPYCWLCNQRVISHSLLLDHISREHMYISDDDNSDEEVHEFSGHSDSKEKTSEIMGIAHQDDHNSCDLEDFICAMSDGKSLGEERSEMAHSSISDDSTAYDIGREQPHVKPNETKPQISILNSSYGHVNVSMCTASSQVHCRDAAGEMTAEDSSDELLSFVEKSSSTCDDRDDKWKEKVTDLRCTKCDKDFTKASQCTAHFTNFHCQVYCPHCNTLVEGKMRFRGHIVNCCPFTCSVCFKMTKLDESFSTNTVCHICSKDYAKGNGSHYLNEHFEINCSHCNNIFTGNVKFKEHAKSCCPYQCQQCLTTLKLFASENSNFSSMKASLSCNDDSTVHCSVCFKLFSSETSLNDHTEAVHTDLHCDICDDSLTGKNAFTIHRKQCVINEKRKPKVDPNLYTELNSLEYACGQRKRKFTEKKALETHMDKCDMACKIHIEEKKPVTSRCTTSDNVKNDFDISQPSDVGENQEKICKKDEQVFQCPSCGKVFKTAKLLKKHIKGIHKESACGHCDKIFSGSKSLKKHKKNPSTTCSQNGKVGCTSHVAEHSNEEATKMPNTHLVPNPAALLNPMVMLQQQVPGAQSLGLMSNVPHLLIPPLPQVMQSSANTSYVCSECSEIFLSIVALQHHRKDKHHIDTQRNQAQFVCNLCEASFTEEVRLLQHLQDKQHIEDKHREKTKIKKSKCTSGNGVTLEKFDDSNYAGIGNPAGDQHCLVMRDSVLLSSQNNLQEVNENIQPELYQDESDIKSETSKQHSSNDNIYWTTDIASHNKRLLDYAQSTSSGKPSSTSLSSTSLSSLDSIPRNMPLFPAHFSTTTTHGDNSSFASDFNQTLKFSCPRCNKCFDKSTKLVQHIQIEHQKQQAQTDSPCAGYCCEICGTTFQQGVSLRQHIAMKHMDSEEECICYYCGEYLPGTDSLQHHLRSSSKCFIEKNSQINTTLQKRMGYGGKSQNETPTDIHHPKCVKNLVSKYTTEEKNSQYENISEASMAIVHDCSEKSVDSGNSYILKCSECHLEFDDNKCLHQHLRDKHNVIRFFCTVCNMAFDKLAACLKHQKAKHCEPKLEMKNIEQNSCDPLFTHHLQFMCMECTFAFSNVSSFEKHIRKQHDVKRHICMYCGELFRKAIKLSAHLQITHADMQGQLSCSHNDLDHQDKKDAAVVIKQYNPLGEQDYTCLYCSSQLHGIKCLKEHAGAKHHVEIYPCAQCNCVFNSYEGVFVHTRDEHGIIAFNIYTCGICNLKFLKKSSLVDHMKHHHSLPVACCLLCDDVFAYENNLQQHNIDMHSSDSLLDFAHSSHKNVEVSNSEIPQAHLSISCLKIPDPTRDSQPDDMSVGSVDESHGITKEKCDEGNKDTPMLHEAGKESMCGLTQSYEASAHEPANTSMLHTADAECLQQDNINELSVDITRKDDEQGSSKSTHSERDMSLPLFMCPICSQEFESLSRVGSHVQTIHDLPPSLISIMCGIIMPGALRFFCSHCMETFTSKAKLKAHINQVHGPFFVCECGEQFLSPVDLKSHKQTFHLSGTLNQYCKEMTFSKQQEELSAIASNSGSAIKSVNCSNIAKDVNAEPQDKPNTLIRCPHCSKSCKHEHSLLQHLNDKHPVHAEMITRRDACCTICHVQFKNQQGLLQHMLDKHQSGELLSSETGATIVDDVDSLVTSTNIHIEQKDVIISANIEQHKSVEETENSLNVSLKHDINGKYTDRLNVFGEVSYECTGLSATNGTPDESEMKAAYSSMKEDCLQLHQKRYLVACHICGMECLGSQGLKTHMQLEHIKEQNMQTDFTECQKRSHCGSVGLGSHKLDSRKPDLYPPKKRTDRIVCRVHDCGKLFNSIHKEVAHLQVEHRYYKMGVIYTCPFPECNKQCQGGTGIRMHISSKHPQPKY